ncbi:prothoracicotropic hormone-like, partial [Trichoplusia ni]|uniref:Prothoracicotropic hormone-like n=1 Tax=Trichoplusia ni TaxID=7111 RepID=A0A7E5VN33_TRINI
FKITRPLVFVIVCFGLFILIQSLVPKVMALKQSNVDEYMLEDQRTRKRKNYVVRLARDGEILDNAGSLGNDYGTDFIKPDPSNPEELSAFIVDYANMIRNDVILLDNSVETRTRKRGNIKVKKFNQAIPDPPCSCQYNKTTKDLGEDVYPRYVETRNCNGSQKTCLPPYICKENLYELIVIRRREWSKQESLELPHELKLKWVAEKRPVSVGCVCTRDYIFEN